MLYTLRCAHASCREEMFISNYCKKVIQFCNVCTYQNTKLYGFNILKFSVNLAKGKLEREGKYSRTN